MKTTTREPRGDALRIERMDIAYGDAEPVVRDVDLRVGSGEIVGVIGESGSGKSSVALASLGLLPDSASILVDRMEVAGQDVTGLDELAWCDLRGRSAGMVFQEPMTALNPCVRVGAQIAEVLRIHGLADAAAARERALELLRLVRMPDPERRLRSYPHQLSGGQRQRVVIAIAMAASPALLVADEATTALDVTVQAQILELLRALRDDTGVGVLFISHDLGVIGQLCDRIAVMYRGRVVETGPAAEVLGAPSHPYTKALLGSIPTRATPARSPLAVIDRAALEEAIA
ncbi:MULTISPECIES: ABC transporter ATP-binding protein [unclassified Curtobacterium]|uniref:ABC transporter ATP-binding protein n=1 Tax=unclassified Curtobacterium TaxID=257496 RepID=UPI000F4C6983|nr:MULTISPECIES: ABC transporter ATP-binding protein [unclassified Curtobacterium]ROP63770.1 peptide/nickel transport system ATP-binding protein [Curtobacterium sp. ZW137]TCK65700.1 peptide/nickel transport system ATP-binding protein [Curtobacterium sp. PhB136]